MRIFYALALVLIATISWAQTPQLKHLPELLKTIDNKVLESENFEVTKSFTDSHNGVSHAYGHQTYKGIEIEGAVFNAHAQNGKVVSFHNNFYAESTFRNIADHSISQNTVISNFLIKNSGHFAPNFKMGDLEWTEFAPNQFEAFDKTFSPEKIKIKKTYIRYNNNLVPSWSLIFLLPDESHWYYTVYNASSGELIEQFDYMLECGFDHDHSEHAFALSDKTETIARKKAAGPTYNAYPFTVESPNHGSRAILTDPSDETASPYGWHDVDGNEGADYTITRGNNVWAKEDVDGQNNTEDGRSPDGGKDLEFDYPFVRDSGHVYNQDAAITNLFVRNNFMHDFLYSYGFDEKSGNFQENNYGKHTSGAGDGVIADAQDGGGSNNANFATPTDGFNPRMQMYLWGTSGSGVTLDVFEPSSFKGSYSAFGATFGAQLTDKLVEGKLVMVSDGTSESTLGCKELVNKADVKGNIALIERGTCTFVEKVRNAQNAGAIAVVIFSDNRDPQTLVGSNANDITIPSIMIARDLGLDLMNEIANTDIEVGLYIKAATGGYDGDFDNGIIAHEYGHGISTRLTGGALNSNCLRNVEQMGEGWSDFFSLVTTHQDGDKATDLRGIGTYATGQATSGGGIRPYPYSADITRSPYVYEDIARLSVPHGIGSVWCAMLWDMYWKFIDVYGYDEDLYTGEGGNNMVIQLVVDGMKLQPCGPSFIDARDAILLADKLNNGGKNQKIIWEAFTSRGLGWDADDGDPNDRNDGKNGFELPPQYSGVILVEKTAVDRIGEDENLKYTISFENVSEVPYYNVVITDTIPEMLELDLNSLDCNWEVNGNVLTMSLDSLDAETKIECTYITKAKPGLHSKIFAEDAAESDVDWTTLSDLGSNNWSLQGVLTYEGSFSWFCDDIEEETDQSLYYEIGTVESGATLTFYHYYNTDYRKDGGVVEFSSDNGETWVDAGDYFILNGYNQKIVISQPLKGRDAFTGTNNEFQMSQIDLSAFVDKQLLVRFRFATDRAIGGDGWYIDDMKVMRFSGVTNRLYASNTNSVSTVAVNTLILETDNEGSSIDNPNVVGAKVYPNPANTGTIIYLPENMEGAVAELADVKGKVVWRRSLVGGKNQIALADVANGSYIITITHNQTTEKHHLVKQ